MVIPKPSGMEGSPCIGVGRVLVSDEENYLGVQQTTEIIRTWCLHWGTLYLWLSVPLECGTWGGAMLQVSLQAGSLIGYETFGLAPMGSTPLSHADIRCGKAAGAMLHTSCHLHTLGRG